MFTRLLFILRNSRTISNLSWLIGGRFLQSLLGFVVSLLTARYLGPISFGTLNYVASFMAFAYVISNLGFDAIIVSELIKKPERRGVILGSAMGLRFCVGLISVIIVLITIYILNPGNDELMYIGILQSIGVIFAAFETFMYWYQMKLLGKYISIVSFIGFILMVCYRILILIYEKNVYYFGFGLSLDYITIGLLYFFFYKHHKGPRLIFSLNYGLKLIKVSYHFILSQLLVTVFSKIDKIMLGELIGQNSVGLYTAAYSICISWTFILRAIIETARPVIMENKGKSEELYHKSIRQLYAIIVWLSILSALLLTIFSKPIIIILFGEQYLGSIPVLRILGWYICFSYLGGARSIWLVMEGKQRFEKYLATCGMITNIVLNIFLIPKFSIMGAAISTLFTEIFINFIIPINHKELRPNAKLIIDAILLRNVFPIKE